ncbi:MAG: LLM class flavin-dependent oxidoreductase [Candidatus Promineifilaceae bacterium]
MPLETRHDVLLHVALRAEELGYDAFIMPETWAYDMSVLLTEIAVRTERIKIGTGIMGMWGRSAGQIAMAAASLNIVSKGRFILGLGASSPPLTEGFHDQLFKKPLTKLRRTLTQVRAILDGKRIPLANTEARPLKLNLPPQPDIPIIVGASSPKSIRLAGEIGNGWYPFLTPKDHLSELAQAMEEGAQASDKPNKLLDIYPILGVMVDDDKATARPAMEWFVSFYMVLMGPLYRNALTRMGYGAAVDSVVQANEGKRPSVVPEDAEILLEQLVVYGSAENARAQLDEWYDAGATMPVLIMNPGLEIAQYDRILEAFAKQA